MRVVDSVFRFFESWIDPFKPRSDYEPPNTLLAYVWHYVGQVKWAFLALLLYGFANAIVEATVFSYVGRLVDVLTEFEATGDKASGWTGLLEKHGGTLLTMLLVIALLRACVVTFGALIEEQVIVPGFFVMMRFQSHKHVVGQSLSFFQNDLAGRISQKVFQSGMATGDMMISLLQVIWFVVVYAFTTAGLLFVLDWQLGVVIAVWMVVFYAIARYFVPKVREHARITAETGSGVTGRMVDGYSNIQTVKLYGSQIQTEDWVLDAMQVHQQAIFKFTRTLTSMRVSLTVVNGIVISLIGWIAVDLWLSDASTLGSVAFVMALVLRLHLLSNRLLGNLNGFFRNVGVTQNTMDLVAHPHGLKDAMDAPEFAFDKGEVEFRDVHFHYDKLDGVISGISLKVGAGEKIGIVGASGCGKTTLVHLMMRFFDVDQGEVLIDGQNVRHVRQNSLRKHFSLVQQDVQMFHRSVFENIALGDPDACLERVQEAARQADAHAFISELKDKDGREGYRAHVGERGVKLSGGQRQRIAIARAIYRNAPILVLDEATSQLDSLTEKTIQQNLLKQMSEKTVFVVAHRLSTIMAMDRIIVMDKGKIIEEGTHPDLLKNEGTYAELWRRQS
ncbi:MAG: ABC transporter ATP-binding protein [Rhizobiaceae bacterium]|nr:ABC transporter ATP-binding protein [Rhizobiaceae bacterium]